MKTENLTAGRRGIRLVPVLFIITLLLATNAPAGAHCDTMDGPVIKDARTALAHNNPAYVLKWVQHADEAELSETFRLTMNVRKLGKDAMTLADKYFFETLIRLHRSGEGMPYTGVKPSGTPVDEKILAADKSIEAGNLNPLQGMVPEEMLPELNERLEQVLALEDYDVNNVDAGRKYVEAYVRFFKYAEGEEDHVHNSSPVKEHNH